MTAGGTRRLVATTARRPRHRHRRRDPADPRAARQRPWDNRSITAAKELPAACSYWAAARSGPRWPRRSAGSAANEVTVVEGGPRLLGREEPFAGDEVAAAFEAEGITVITGARVTAVRRDADGVDGPVVATLADGREFEADEILVAVGRRPATAALGLERSGSSPDGSSTSTISSVAMGVRRPVALCRGGLQRPRAR